MMVNEISKQSVSMNSGSVASDMDMKPVESANEQKKLATDAEKTNTPVALIDDTVNRLNKAVQSVERDLQFQVDESSGDIIIKVLDRQTNEVIRQIPTDEVLAVRKNIESLKGILFSAKV